MKRKRLFWGLSVILIVVICAVTVMATGVLEPLPQEIADKYVLIKQERDLMASKVQANAAASQTTRFIQTAPKQAAPMPESLSRPSQVDLSTAGGLPRSIRSANTLWLIGGDPDGTSWNEVFAWSGTDAEKRFCIGVWVMNGMSVGDFTEPCPDQSLGQLSIVAVQDRVLTFKTESGATGVFDCVKRTWRLDKA